MSVMTRTEEAIQHLANLEMARIGALLRDARESAAEATREARNAAVDAHAAGMSEIQIAKHLGVDRETVRRWLGKTRKRY